MRLDHLAGLLGVDWLKAGETNRIFTAMGLTITGVALSMTVLTVRHVRKVTTGATRGFTPPDGT